jgi:opacity protein-like surface antigen
LCAAKGVVRSKVSSRHTHRPNHHPSQDAPAPPPSRHREHARRKTPRAELFLGYSRFGTGIKGDSVTAGNRMVGLNGGSASVAFNFNRYLGLVGDFGGYDANKLVLSGIGTNQSFEVNASGTAYTYTFGPRLSFRNDSRFTPFVQILGGGVHASEVTVDGCAGSTCTPLPTQNAFALLAGGGLDIRLTEHLALRAIQAEYMMTRFNNVPAGGSSEQNDLRLSSGLVFRFGGSAPPPVQLACTVQPAAIFPGDDVTVTATATDLNPKHAAEYHWNSTGGAITGSGSSVQIDSKGLAPGTYTVSGNVTQGRHPADQANCSSSFTVQAPEPPTISCSANPSSLAPGDSSTITAQATSPQNRPLTYSYSATSGNIQNSTASAVLNTAGVDPGTITITCNVVDDLGKSASATTTVAVVAPPPPVVAVPQVHNLCSLSFERDHKRPERVDNEAKACLDDIALQMQHESTGQLVIIGKYAADEKPRAASERALNAGRYLTTEKGINTQRIQLRMSPTPGDRTTTDVFVPEGATYAGDDTTPVNLTMDHHSKPHKRRR